ncbi:transcriptional regulator GcvA [Snodgrassella sp. CFCC 13594]|uniref:transcriptional regulator GcvA n=1 Tax=Snodgrassella sp. CFCC 13594 TaxID=1775559 RepID=UPI000831B1DB|nr:transcriptional regulator GcvA [Snodgrassella sp. CFCC 13594]
MKLPPMNALIAFDAIARHMSVMAAAKELHLSASAVSQQLAKLEQALGICLFYRQPRRLVLTPEGDMYAQSVRHAIQHIAEATNRITDSTQKSSIAITTTSGFTTQWLLPHLPEFEQQFPDVDIQLNTDNRMVNLLTENFDFAIRHGSGIYPGLQTELLMDDPLIPVCSPQLLAPNNGVNCAADLLQLPLLHDEQREDWRLWLKAMNVDTEHARSGPVFTNSNGVIQAALAGCGVALVRQALVVRELSRQQLLVPLPAPIAATLAYYLVYDALALRQKINQQFRKWLLNSTLKMSQA